MLDLHGFVSAPDKFEGLYKITDDLQQNKLRNEHLQQQQDAKNASMTKFLTDYADPKEHLSGSPLDPAVTKGFSDILQQGVSLIHNNKGLTNDMLMLSIAPQVGKLAQYANKAKAIKQGIDKRIAEVDPTSGYDKLKLAEAATKNAWTNSDGTQKSLDQIDPSIDYVSEAVKNNPAEVTNNKGFDEYLKGIEKNVSTTQVTRWNQRGGKESRKVKVTAPAGFVPDTDAQGVATGKFVPEYDIATDDGNPILHEFDDGKGGKVTAPVRMVKDAQFNRVMANSHGTADWVRGQVMQHLNDYKDANGNAVSINSPQAKNIAKAIIFDEMKSRNVGSMEDVIESKPTQIKVYAPRQPRAPTDGQIKQQEDEDNLHKTLNDRPKDANGYIETSDVLSGINILNVFKNAIKGAAIKFNPEKKVFQYKTSKGIEEMPYHEFATLAATANPGTDMKWLKGFKTYERQSDVPDEQPAPEKEKTFWGIPLKNKSKTTTSTKGKYD